MMSLTACCLVLLAYSCSDLTDEGNILPPGKYPMTFTAAVDGLTATRATTVDGEWAGGEEVAIQIGDDVKKYTAASGGNLTVATSGTPFYWQTATEVKTVSAWYSLTYSPTKPATFSVQEDQSSNGYQKSDFLYATPQDITYISGGSSSELKFKHLPAKVVVNLKYGEGVTAGEVTAATVRLVNQATASGAITEADGTVTQATPGNATIIPMPQTAASGYQQSVQALLVPQQMQSKKFVKVTIGTGTAAECDYYYIPTGDDANLEAGKQYTYTITVKKTGLEVTVTGNGTSWTDKTITGSTDGTTQFHITAPATGVTIEAAAGSGGNLTDNGSGSYTLSGGNKITITATSTYIKSIKGLYDVAGDGTTYTLKSDILITEYALADAKVGDFYCKSSDGSTGYLIPGDIASLTEEQIKVCLGVVMKVGKDGSGDWQDADSYTLKGTTTEMPIHGYVLALKNGNGGNACAWGSAGTQVSTNQSQYTLFCGYSNTQTIKTASSSSFDSSYPAAYHASVGYETRESGKYSSPGNSSGWFLPSAGQCWYWFQNKDLLLASMTKAGGDGWRLGEYWSSSENSNNPARSAWLVNFEGRGSVAGGFKGNGDDYKVRSCLAF